VIDATPIPVMAARGDHDPYTLGIGDTKFGVKDRRDDRSGMLNQRRQ
jgi:hypothetical protein